MNFLSHALVLPRTAPKVARIGSALPDLWSRLRRRLLPLVILRELQDLPDDAARDLAYGVRSHLAADGFFHGHPVFVARCGEVATDLHAAWPALRHADLMAHVLVEMLADRWLMSHEPGLLDWYYEAFDADTRQAVAALSTREPVARQEVAAMLELFAGSQFLRDYPDAGGLAGRFLRMLARSPFAAEVTLAPADLAPWVERWSARYVDVWPPLLEEVRVVVQDRPPPWEAPHAGR